MEKNSLEYAIAYQLEKRDEFMIDTIKYELIEIVYDYNTGLGCNTLAVVYNYSLQEYEVLVVSDEKVGKKSITILNKE